MNNNKIVDYLLNEISKSENLYSDGGLKKIFAELMEIEKYENNTLSKAEEETYTRFPVALTYCGKKKITLCCAPGCNVPTYYGHRFCECHKHEYENISDYKLKQMFPAQRKIPMVGIYGSFWTWLHEYMNKRSKKTGFEAAKQEHRMHRIVQYIAASTILTVEDIENYLMMKPNCSKNYTNKCNFERGESYKPTQVIDKLLKNEANLTNIFIK